ncbi:hypothetical protein E2C01_099975 [Portunus trituberculatus]|uniref:Uncharacterized protein n=1 Tax=Portunus trituberculatus TaxID=210409 RepID=A0A5B7KBS4_PORTR|nr:hypothetical protein [Portunus trituberculatus]
MKLTKFYGRNGSHQQANYPPATSLIFTLFLLAKDERLFTIFSTLQAGSLTVMASESMMLPRYSMRFVGTKTDFST